jgi:hypothetical protein
VRERWRHGSAAAEDNTGRSQKVVEKANRGVVVRRRPDFTVLHTRVVSIIITVSTRTNITVI